MRNFSALRVRAGEILSQNGNRLLFLGAQAIILFAAAVLLLLLYVLSLAFSTVWAQAHLWAESVFAIVVPCFVAFILSPLCFGFLFMAKRACLGMHCGIGDLFYAFRSRESYARAVLAMAGAGLAVSVSVTLLMLLGLLSPYLAVLAPFFAFLPLLVLLIFWLLTSLFYTRAYGALSEVPLSRPGIRCRLLCGLRFWCGFLPWILLGILMVGILLVFDVIPRMVIARVLDCEELCGTEDGIGEDEYYAFPDGE